MTVLVTGGAGYIGSHMGYALRDAGRRVVVLDNLVTGVRAQVCPEAEFIEGSVADSALVDEILKSRGIEAVVHFAGSVVVPESVENPLKYYQNNSGASAALVQACLNNGVRNFVFSSTAAPGHTRSMRSYLLTSSPPASTRTSRISNARLPMGTETPRDRNSRRSRSISHSFAAGTARGPCSGIAVSAGSRNPQNFSALTQGIDAPNQLKRSFWR